MPGGQRRRTCSEYADAATQVVERARAVLSRLEEGIALLESNAEAREAFRFANLAMWQQRVRSVWIEARKAEPALPLADVDIPKNRSWRAFQLAFILINLPALTSLHHPDRGTDSYAGADLLWFPTGGGKTEAYLGLAAYTMAIRRLQKNAGGRDGENGVAVLMRYTLRLLTLQQFQRAATLMCACEQIRQNNAERWGETPFRLGLWVGRKTTPNRTAQSAEVVEKLRSGGRPVFGVGSPHQFSACPWCGTPIDPGQHITVEHYPSGRARTIDLLWRHDGAMRILAAQVAGRGPADRGGGRGDLPAAAFHADRDGGQVRADGMARVGADVIWAGDRLVPTPRVPLAGVGGYELPSGGREISRDRDAAPCTAAPAGPDHSGRIAPDQRSIGQPGRDLRRRGGSTGHLGGGWQEGAAQGDCVDGYGAARGGAGVGSIQSAG